MEVNLICAGVLLAIFAYLYRWITRNNDYFHDKPIPSMAVRPILGSTGPLMLRKVVFQDFIRQIYNKYPGVKVFGTFDTITPFFVIRDPELIKQIGIKDFNHFVDHRPIFGHDDDDHAEHPKALFIKTLVAKNGQRWKEMRAILSPAFTGSKMRQMFSLVGECCDGMVNHYLDLAKATGRVEVEMKDMMSRISINVIASCAFGIKVNCFKEQEHEFVYHGKKMINFSRPIVIARLMMMRIFPKFAARFGIDMLDGEQADYFTRLLQKTIETRESKKIIRHDMIDLLLQARKGNLKHQEEKDDQEGFATVQEFNVGKVEITKNMTEAEMIAQCLIFFLGGFETVSSCAMLTAYELVRNPEVQQKLYEEILQTEQELGGKPLSYDALQKMKYMDMVVSESLRIWPLAPAADRLCTQDYIVDDGQGLKFTIDKGACVWFPTAGLHHDPQYFPNPEKFDPERFNDENKKEIDPGTYLPFGIGPRNCIGSRFALMEVKAFMYYILHKFSFVSGPKTEIPLQLRKGLTHLGAENGVHLVLKLR
ncbi:probable cytochrome P450 9f2 [Armigeres subalbatus]|uniref:probable cytochrome P450 9f2 n=1 Tax=Armigeres subalbatus TaxID=124917 RepID=UPI002ED54C0B